MSDRRDDHSRFCTCECLDERAEYSKPEYHDDEPEEEEAEDE